jgi:hypothetical protein
VWGLGLITLWSGRHGAFPAKGAPSRPREGAPDRGEPEGSDGADAVVPQSESGERNRTGQPANATTADDRPE